MNQMISAGDDLLTSEFLYYDNYVTRHVCSILVCV
jgi:hypothetical protein